MMFGGENRPADAKAVGEAASQFVMAAKNGDQAALEKLISEDLVYSHSSGMTENKQQAIAAMVKSKPYFEFQGEPDIKIYGGGKVATFRTKLMAHNNASPAR